MDLSPLNLKVLSDVLVLAGHARESWLGLYPHPDPNALRDEDWVEVEAFDALMRVALQVSGDSCFGLVAGTSPALMRYTTQASLVLHAPDLHTVLDDLERHGQLTVAITEMQVVVESGQVQLRLQPMATTALGLRFRSEQLLAGLAMMLRLFGIHEQHRPGVDLAYPAAGAEDRYRAVLGMPARFGQPFTALRFDASLLAARGAMHDPAKYQEALARLSGELAASQARTSVVQRVRMLVLRSLGDLPEVSQAAVALSLSERTLRRHLSAAGTSWTGLVDECRRSRAEQLLLSGLSLGQLAERLGFAEACSFVRAFRRWTGQPPQSWRRQFLASAQGAERSTGTCTRR